MVKELKQRYPYKGERLKLSDLRKKLRASSRSQIIGSLVVTTKNAIPVKLVFVKNRSNSKEYLVLLSTDISLSDNEIVRLYGIRWSIEVFFKSTRSLLKLGKEFQGTSFDMFINHTFWYLRGI